MSSLITESSDGVLHLITQLSTPERLIDYGRCFLRDHHAVVLMEEAVYRVEAYLGTGYTALRAHFCGDLFILKEDCLARGLSLPLPMDAITQEPVSTASLIDYSGLVDLTVKYRTIRNLSLD